MIFLYIIIFLYNLLNQIHHCQIFSLIVGCLVENCCQRFEKGIVLICIEVETLVIVSELFAQGWIFMCVPI